MPTAIVRACVLTLTVGFLHGIDRSRPGPDDPAWYVASGKSGRTDGANALYEFTRRQHRRTPSS